MKDLRPDGARAVGVVGWLRDQALDRVARARNSGDGRGLRDASTRSPEHLL